MPEDTLNPYAPPADPAPAAEPAGLWRVEGDYLIVQERAKLPPVDLDGRGKGGPLMPLMLNLPVPIGAKGAAAILIPMACGVAGYLTYKLALDSAGGWFGLIASIVIPQFLLRGVAMRSVPAFLWGEISVPALRASSRRVRWRARLMGGSLVGPLAVGGAIIAGADVPLQSWLEYAEIGIVIFVASLLLIVAVAFWSVFDTTWRCVKARDGWVWIKGLGPHALAGLAARASEPVPAVVKRRVYKMDLNKLPLSFWYLFNGYNPLAWLRILWLKAARPKMLESLNFHWSEREWLPPERADTELLETWTRMVADTPLAGWGISHVERVGLPNGSARVEEIVLLSPDGLHAAMPVVTRIADGRRLREIHEITFRSWTRDGRIIATGNLTSGVPMPDEFQFVLAKGDAWQVAQVHLQRTASVDLVMMDSAGLRRRAEEEMERRQELLEATGYCSPAEEMEMPGEWA